MPVRSSKGQPSPLGRQRHTRSRDTHYSQRDGMVSWRRDIKAAGPSRRSLPLAVPPVCRLLDHAHGFSQKILPKIGRISGVTDYRRPEAGPHRLPVPASSQPDFQFRFWPDPSRWRPCVRVEKNFQLAKSPPAAPFEVHLPPMTADKLSAMWYDDRIPRVCVSDPVCALDIFGGCILHRHVPGYDRQQRGGPCIGSFGYWRRAFYSLG